MAREWIVPKTRKARIAQRIGIAIGMLMILFPPWREFYFRWRGMPPVDEIGYHPLWSPPTPGEIALGYLFLQLLFLLVITKTVVRFLNRSYPQ